MPARGERRRASRGNTHDPYECCGAEAGTYGRQKGSICADCRLLINLGKAAKAKADADVVTGAMQPYWFVKNEHSGGHWYPYIDVPGTPGRDQLQAALYDLVWAVGESAEGQPSQSPVEKKPSRRREFPDYEPWPFVIDNDAARRHGSNRYNWKELVMLRPALRDVINRLDEQIREAIRGAYQKGKETGGSILFSLASGEKSLADWELAMLTPEERAERERARRGY